MRRRVLAVALGAVALAALALGRAPGPRPSAPVGARPVPSPPAEAVKAWRRAVDPEAIRDLFRFAGDAPRLVREEVSEARAEEEKPDVTSPAPSGPRLVGLVTRAGRRLAALARDGEVELAGPGEAAAGVTVLAVDDEGVRIRRADGTEETLVLP